MGACDEESTCGPCRKNRLDVNVMRLLGAGLTTMDIYRHRLRMYPGGNEYNIAYNAKTLGADSAFMGTFADDALGGILETVIRDHGVDIGHSRWKSGTSGYAIVDLQEGDRVFLDWNKAGVTDRYPLKFTEEEVAYLKTFDIVCMSAYSRVPETEIQRLHSLQVPICYDFCDTFTEQELETLGPCLKYAFLSCSHISEEETRGVLRYLARCGCELAVGTRGGKPSIAYDGSSFFYQEAEKVDAMDTMGAGDAYISAFLVSYLSEAGSESGGRSDRVRRAMRCAAEFAATVVMKPGSLGVGYDTTQQEITELERALKADRIDE